MAGGDFSPEAYEQLREAYAKEEQNQKTAEEKGHDIMGLNLGLETAPVDSPWADKIDNWEYPSGKSQYLDEHQDPAEILQLMRDAAQEKIDAASEDSEEEEEEEEEETTAEVETEEVEEAEDEESEEQQEEEEEPEVEAEAKTEESDEEDEDEEEETLPEPDDIAAEIAELRAELEQMQFVPGNSDDES